MAEHESQNQNDHPSIKESILETKLENAQHEIKSGEDRILNLEDENRTLRNYLSFVYKHVNESQIKPSRSELQRRFNNAVAKYRLEIYQNRFQKENENATLYLQQNNELKELVMELKMENIQMKTDSQQAFLQINDLQDHFSSIEQYFQKLSNEVDDTFTTYQSRIEKAYDKLHQLKCEKKKRKFSLFSK